MSEFTIHHGDCLDILRTLADGSVDAIVTDPPYGIGADEAAAKNKGKWGWKFYGHTDWDKSRPEKRCFDAMASASKKMAIWGGNYFADLLPPSMGWLVWDKGQRDFSLADFEMAWTSEQKAARCLVYPRAKANNEGDRYHPTQKPVWVMKHTIEYLNLPIGCTVLDPFMGSGTTGVACMETGRNFIGIEIDAKYCDIARKRIKSAQDQGRLFSAP